jgi:hypothetical protein
MELLKVINGLDNELMRTRMERDVYKQRLLEIDETVER